MAPLVCHQRQKCADSLTAEAGLACCGPTKTMLQVLPVWPAARGPPSAASFPVVHLHLVHVGAQKHFQALTSTFTSSPLVLEQKLDQMFSLGVFETSNFIPK